MSRPGRWARLRDHLDGLDPESTAAPLGGRIGATLALLRDVDDDLEFIFTRRRDDLANHPGQISFAGGRVEVGETVEQAALREAAEEMALDPAGVAVLGRLRPFYVPVSRFWIQTVVARWDDPHPLRPSEVEVAEVVCARVSVLTDRRTWRAVRLSHSGWSWAWQLDHRHLLWGATAMVTAELLDVVEPDWSGGLGPADLHERRVLRPWTDGRDAGRQSGPARLPGVAEHDPGTVSHGGPEGPPRGPALDNAATATAEAVRRLSYQAEDASVVVLAGAGGNGLVGLEAAVRLASAGVDVQAVLVRPAEDIGDAARQRATSLGEQAAVFAGELPRTGVVVDALVGGGLKGPLGGVAHEIVLALRHHYVPVVSLDLPSGLHPDCGIIGDIVPADVTVSFGRPRAALFEPGLAAYVGDLYLTDLESGALTRLVYRPV